MTKFITKILKVVLQNSFPSVAAKQCLLRNFVVLTLLLQTSLMLVGPFLKKTSSRLVLVFAGMCYIYSDWASNYAVGVIPSFTHSSSSSTRCSPDILLLWSSFLLLHIGGSDSISALTPTDNELWSRFAIQLATMSYGIANAFYRSFLDSKLRVPVSLMFVAGLTKFLERLLSFFRARFSALKTSILEEKIKSSSSSSRISVDLEDLGDLSEAKMARDAYCLFQTFKPLFVDLPIASVDRNKTKAYFMRINTGDAFRVVEIELNFYYDLFYSKVPVLRQWLGRSLRLVGMACEVIALVLWFRIDKRNFIKYDIWVTYSLLLGAVARDFISLLMITFSAWTIASSVRSSDGSSRAPNLWIWLPLHCSSELISQLNFMDLCNFCCTEDEDEDDDISHFLLKSTFFYKILGWVPRKRFTNDQRELVFQELREIASEGNDCLKRGQTTLENYGVENEELFLSRVHHKTFDESLLLWHIATTTLCYDIEEGLESLEESKFRYISKVVSDYLFYLLLRHPEVMAEVAAMGDVRYEDTRAEAERFFEWLCKRRREREGGDEHDRRRMVKEVFEGLLREVPENEGLGDKGKSVLFDAGRLARELIELKEKQGEKMWEMIAKVWLEMLSYCAARCSPAVHATQLAHGREFITQVWLLMEHLGLGNVA